ncbi:MAG: CRTAC1 family protein [Planctomycetes bacterium]|nr:CRTAC1 family protein [Planctomycetota bacterium]
MMRMQSITRGFVTVVFCTLLMCSSAETNFSGESAFNFTTLKSSESGIDLILTSGKQPTSEILEVNGGGLALIDFDNDGDQDLFITNGATLKNPEAGPGSRLYENLGNLKFRDVTQSAGINLFRWAMGAAVGDYNGDGFDDIFVTCYGANVLLRNNGDKTFTDVTSQAGLADNRWGTSSAFSDLDNDGDLDLYVVNYLVFDVDNPPNPSNFKGVEVMAGPSGLPPQHDILYENLGNGTFADITQKSGCLKVPPSFGLGVIIIDFDLDGKQDIFVGNDSMINFFFHNKGNLQFEEKGLFSGLAANIEGGEQATMGIAIADVDGNGYPDVFTTNFSSDTNTLHLNVNGSFFDDRTQQYGLAMVSRTYLGWSAGFADFDLDGDEDLLFFNGHVYPQATMGNMESDYHQKPLLFERIGRRFSRVTDFKAAPFLEETRSHRTALFADLDQDGDIDIVTTQLGGPVKIVRNDQTAGNWLSIQLQDKRSQTQNRRGLGSTVKITYEDSSQLRWIYTGGYQASNAPIAHFGLPENLSKVSIQITWPDGYTQLIDGLNTKSHHSIKRD